MVRVIKQKLEEICVLNDVETDKCETKAKTDEDYLYKYSKEKNDGCYVIRIAEYLAIVERCILMGWENKNA
jgi:hypothetical protein